MSASQITGLSKPTAADKISLGDLGYVNARNRQRAYNLVIKEFKKSGLTQAALAARLGKNADVVCRLLGRPRNWELDTFSSLLFAISGAVPTYDVIYPLGKSDNELFPEKPTFHFKSETTTSHMVRIDPAPGEFKVTKAAA